MSSVETTEFGLRGGVTRREAEILSLVGNRLSNREIADHLYISVRTVESHVSSLLAKLGASDRRALVALADQLKAPAPSHNLPRRPDSFVGRDAEQRHLAEVLAGHRLVTIVGPPGVGKTRLATETALGLLDRYEEGVWLVELADVADPKLVVPSVMAVLGLRAPPGGDPLEALVAGAATRRSLVVLDNCEHLAGSAAAVAEAVTTRTDSLAVLATSRHPLGTSGERVVQLDPLLVEPSVRLFADRAGAAQDGFELTDHNTDSVTRLVERLDRIPLAVELAASRIRAFTPAELLDHLGIGIDLIGTSAAAGRHRTLTGTIAWSYRLLSTGERLLFGRLCVFAGFNLAAAQTVCAGDGLAGDKIPALLSDLVDHSLVFPLPGTSPHRYRMLESIRAFAGGRLKDRCAPRGPTRGTSSRWPTRPASGSRGLTSSPACVRSKPTWTTSGWSSTGRSGPGKHPRPGSSSPPWPCSGTTRGVDGREPNGHDGRWQTPGPTGPPRWRGGWRRRHG